MARFFGIRCLLNARKLLLPKCFVFRRGLALDAISHCYKYKHSSLSPFTPVRGIQLSAAGLCENEVEKSDSSENKPVDPSKDRSKVIPPEVSIRYLNSKAYRTTYGDEPVWVKYRRNFKGQFAPKKTRSSCIKEGILKTGNPCPICRDEYLVVHYSNVELLKQFISPYTGEIYPTTKTNVCRAKQFDLQIAVQYAKDLGLLTYEVPFRTYNYEEYYPQLRKQDEEA